MEMQSAHQLANRRCVPCEGGVEPCSIAHSQQQMTALDNWQLDEGGKRIARQWRLKNFVEAMKLVQAVADLAEAEQHHPDLHVTGYRQVLIELTTHAIGGLSENDFILAAKIDAVSKEMGL